MASSPINSDRPAEHGGHSVSPSHTQTHSLSEQTGSPLSAEERLRMIDGKTNEQTTRKERKEGTGQLMTEEQGFEARW